ncbi:hypothetical protein HMPREF9371_1546 [Neisseria shayeganii 871]|uniref:Uncharacterized protein n=1 Tax=Neisseria shayeganii 871 TaxID=1032488 RepID=G4CIV7_9NEIS|nr:hypothetical protein HMPREF9371_1546 [Neisseria shayeganii 871]
MAGFQVAFCFFHTYLDQSTPAACFHADADLAIGFAAAAAVCAYATAHADVAVAAADANADTHAGRAGGQAPYCGQCKCINR